MHKIKKIYFVSIFLVAILSIFIFIGCNSSKINVIARDAASGTRFTFDSLMDIDEVKKDASYLSSTGMVLSCVNRDKRAIGYVSYNAYKASKNAYNKVKTLSIDGISVEDSRYTIAHTLNLAYRQEIERQNETLQYFLAYLKSIQANKIIQENGYIITNTIQQDFQIPKQVLTKNCIIGGSTSIEPLMQKLVENFKKIVGDNLKGKIEIQGGGSSKGITGVKDKSFSLGMVSREIKDSEKEGLKQYALAKEAIVIIVNTKNNIENLSRQEIKAIYEGNITNWIDIIS